jgi:ankyrin repeat protein
MRNYRLTAERLVSLPRTSVNAQNKDGNTPLLRVSLASNVGKDVIINLLLSHPKIKVKVNETNKAGSSALHSAPRPGCTSALKRLLHPKIKVNQADAHGITAS